MERKEQIILAALELASINGLKSVSMSQIAEKLGIRKPSLYNHFRSKEELITAMYEYLRERSRARLSLSEIDYGAFIREKTAEQALLAAVKNYVSLTEDRDLLAFYRIIYSERAVDPAAAAIITEETERMILATKNLFYALQAHGKISVRNIDTAAVSFAMTVHAILDYQIDCAAAGKPVPEDMMENTVRWFCGQMKE